MDPLTWLRLHVEWGADEALDPSPRDRLRVPPKPAPDPHAAPVPVPPPARALSAERELAALRTQDGVATAAEEIAAAATDLASLEAAMASFSLCPLQATATHTVLGEGPPNGILILADSPGEHEDRGGRPMLGPGGRLLEAMLASIGLTRAAVRLGYAVPWRPPGNRRINEIERRICRPFLLRHLALAAPRLLLLLGQSPTAMLGLADSGRWRTGALRPLTLAGRPDPLPVLATYAPEYLLATPAAKREAWADLILLRRHLDRVGLEQPP